MNNFLEICRVVNNLSGIQGTVDDCVNPTGIQRQVVECTRQAWIQLQMLRPDANFLYSGVTFNTTSGKGVYTLADIFGLATPNVGSYITNQFVYNKNAIPYIPWDQYIFQDITTAGPPTWVTYDPANRSILMNKQNGIYPITVKYFRNPQSLVQNIDVPLCNAGHWYAIVYKALEGMAVQTGNQGLSSKYSVETAFAVGQFLRSFIKQKHVQLNGGFA